MWNRRQLLTLPWAASVRAASRPLRLSIRVEPLFPGLPLSRQLELVAEAGYTGYEFGDWRIPSPREIVPLQRRLKLDCVCLVGNRGVNPVGMGLCNPAERDGFLAEIAASAEACDRFETSKMVVLSGFRVPGMSREAMHASMVEGLKRAHDIVARRKVTMIVEVINTLAPVEPLNPKGDNHSRYFLDRTPEAFQMVREVGSPYFRILYDLYHSQIMEGNLIATLRDNVEHIGHIHVADVPGRHEPGTGEIHYGNVFLAIRMAGYSGYVGMEYIPSRDALTTLREVRQLANP